MTSLAKMSRLGVYAAVCGILELLRVGRGANFIILGFDCFGSGRGGVCFPSETEFLFSMCLLITEQSVLDGS